MNSKQDWLHQGHGKADGEAVQGGGRRELSPYLRETVVLQIEFVLLVNHIGLGFLLVGGAGTH